MQKDDKKISKIIKENYNVPDNVNQRIDDVFVKIRKQSFKSEDKKINRLGAYKMDKNKVFYKVAGVLIALFICGNAIALAFGENNIYTAIYKFFVPNDEEKIENIVIEGIDEKVDYNGVESSLGYSILYDNESINLKRIDNKDYYRVNIPEIEEKVYFVIYHVDTEYENLKDNVVEEANIGGKSAFMNELIDGKKYNENNSYAWDSDVVNTWHIDAGKGTYIVEFHYFMEATEGWGVRFRRMLDSFKIVEE